MDIKKEKFEEYKNRVISLESNFVQAYRLYYYLLEIENRFKNFDFSKLNILCLPFRNLHYTICYTFRQELISLVWKINLDTRSKANTLDHLKRDLETLYFNDVKILDIKKTNRPDIERQIRELRHHMISHTDKDVMELPVNMNDVKILLDSFLDIFKQLVFDNVIDCSKAINVSAIQNECAAGIDELYSGSVYKLLKGGNDE